MKVFEFKGWDYITVKVFLKPWEQDTTSLTETIHLVNVCVVDHVELHVHDEVVVMSEKTFLELYGQEGHDILNNAMEEASNDL